MLKRLVKIVIILAVLLPWPGTALAQQPLARWLAPEGIEYISYSQTWTKQKLSALHDELKQNTHGSELAYLESVSIYPHSDNFANGTYEQVDRAWILSIQANGFLPPSHLYRTRMGQISLYNGDQRDSPEAMARTLAHEYGHHFTYFHFFDRKHWRNSEYYLLRDLGQYPLVDDYASMGVELYKDYWAWDVGEIAAEDYVQLMGSPTARQLVTGVMDIRGMLSYSLANPGVPESRIWTDNLQPTRGGNTYPHGNIFLPLPLETPGLAEYFYSYLDQEPLLTFREVRAPELSYTQTAPDQYLFTWQPVSSDANILYTLMAYDEQRNSWSAIKTVRGPDDNEALVGTAREGRYSWSDNIAQGTKHFRIYATYPDGYMSSSPVVSVRFSGEPTTKEPIDRNSEDYSLSVSASQTETRSQAPIAVELNWHWRTLMDSPLLLAQAIAVTDSPETPDIWDWQQPEDLNTTTVDLEQPGTWYIHYHLANDQETARGTFGPYIIEEQ
ncbi:MAG: hypothetical protein FH749_04725 [Firmicutes bacterium]|nr:hypothetical protein [Bacillota bacterium]